MTLAITNLSIPSTELRDCKEKLVLYTNDQAVIEKAIRWRSYLGCQVYIKGNQIIARDLYFDRTAKQQLERLVKDASGTIAY